MLRMSLSLTTKEGILEPRQGWIRRFLSYVRWSPTSPIELAEAEEEMLGYVQTHSEGYYVNLGKVNGDECRVWTRRFHSPNSSCTPLVMVHGMGAGLAMFALNYDSLAKHRPVYALDLPGFGRSSRVDSPEKTHEIETQYVECLEKWRQSEKLGRMVLLGHSFGGYLTALYCLKYPQNIEHAILADPWGMKERPDPSKNPRVLPLWVKLLSTVLQHFNPLWGLRASGPWGPWVVARSRPDIMKKYEGLVGEGNTRVVSDYLYHCNAHSPTGETAFHRLMGSVGWAKNPILPRLADLSPDLRLHCIYGANTWMSHLEEQDFLEAGVKAEVTVRYIQDAGHHVYADQHQLFNEAVNSIK